jgi:hypothetical protein
VRALSFTTEGSNNAGPPAALQQPIVPQQQHGTLVYSDPWGVRACLWRSAPIGQGDGGGTWVVFVAGLAPDNTPVEVRCLPPGGDPLRGIVRRCGGGGSGGGSDDEASRTMAGGEARVSLAAAHGLAASGSGWVGVLPVDSAARMAVSSWGGWLFARWVAFLMVGLDLVCQGRTVC